MRSTYWCYTPDFSCRFWIQYSTSFLLNWSSVLAWTTSIESAFHLSIKCWEKSFTLFLVGGTLTLHSVWMTATACVVNGGTGVNISSLFIHTILFRFSSSSSSSLSAKAVMWLLWLLSHPLSSENLCHLWFWDKIWHNSNAFQVLFRVLWDWLSKSNRIYFCTICNCFCQIQIWWIRVFSIVFILHFLFFS